jgi:hypothetical protein
MVYYTFRHPFKRDPTRMHKGNQLVFFSTFLNHALFEDHSLAGIIYIWDLCNVKTAAL